MKLLFINNIVHRRNGRFIPQVIYYAVTQHATVSNVDNGRINLLIVSYIV